MLTRETPMQIGCTSTYTGGAVRRARTIHDDFDRLIGTGLTPFREQGYVDTTYDRLMGMVAGFLGPEYFRVRDPYPSVTPEHARELRAWMAEHTPALLRLD